MPKNTVSACAGFLKAFREALGRWLKQGFPLVFRPITVGASAGAALPGPGTIVLFGGGTGSSQEDLLEETLKFMLKLRKQCEMYLNARTKAFEFPVLGNKNLIVREPNEIYKYSGDPEKMVCATFNTLSELVCRDMVHKRIGLRFSPEEFADLPVHDRINKLMRHTIMVYQILCSTQSAFKNLQIPGKIESAIG